MAKRAKRAEAEPVERLLEDLTAYVARTLRDQRGFHGLSVEALADAMTQLGVPTRPATLRRVEAGTQPVSLEQFMLLAPMVVGSVHAFLSDGFRLGALRIEGPGDVRALLLLEPRLEPGSPRALIEDTFSAARDAQRRAQLADLAGCSEADVERAWPALRVSPADFTLGDEIAQRHQERLWEMRPEPEAFSHAWRAQQTWALRNLADEIRSWLDAQGTHS